MGFLLRLVGFAAFASLFSGCVSRVPPDASARQVLREYAQALRARDASLAWSLLHEDARRETSFLAFETWLHERPDEVEALASALQRPIGPQSEVRMIPIEGNVPVALVRASGGYRVRLSSVDRYSQLTPRLALNTFVQAAKQRRYDVLLRLAPKAVREKLPASRLVTAFEGPESSRLTALARSIELALPSGRIDVNVDRATFDLGAGVKLSLLLEDGAWTIADYLP